MFWTRSKRVSQVANDVRIFSIDAWHMLEESAAARTKRDMAVQQKQSK